MRSFEGKTADDAWRQAAEALLVNGAGSQPSRLGQTRELLRSTFEITEPRQRWVTSRTPSINPAFALAEVIWILLGRRDAEFINFWNPILPKFAGDQNHYHGAYGYRIRGSFGFDQLERAYEVLSKNPSSRQVILQIWEANNDLPQIDGSPSSPDVPCNICAMPKVREGKLEWLQVMRSNDLLLGSPYNFVQFSTLQEVLAGWLDIEVGTYAQISDSLHVYTDDLDKYSMSDTPMAVLNTDSIALPKTESEDAIRKIGDVMERLRSPSLSRKEFTSLLSQGPSNKGFMNILRVIAADAARRREWHQIGTDIMSDCDNPVFNGLWKGWSSRHGPYETALAGE